MQTIYALFSAFVEGKRAVQASGSWGKKKAREPPVRLTRPRLPGRCAVGIPRGALRVKTPAG